MDNRIDFELFESTDVGFMQDADPGADSVESIGSMTIVFDSCDSGVVTYETQNDEVGSGSFRIERLLEIMNTHCTGGISDDMHSDGMFGNQNLKLNPAREGIIGGGFAVHEGHGDVKFSSPAEDGHRLMNFDPRGERIEIHDGDVYGHLKFRDPENHGREHLDFDPRGQLIEVFQADVVILNVEFPTE